LQESRPKLVNEAAAEQNALLAKLSAEQLKLTELAGEKSTHVPVSGASVRN